MEIITRNEKILYIGIDVHKDTYSLWSFDFHKNELSDEMTIKATTKAVIKYLEAIKKKHKEEILFACGYEAGPAGTTNAIKSLNSTYRKLNRQRSVFPSDQALLKALYLATFEATKKWTLPLRDWGRVYGEMCIMYEGRLPD